MKKSGLLNPQLCAAVARLGHTQTFVVADAGLPIPADVPVVDLALVLGTPRFQEVFDAILDEVASDGIDCRRFLLTARLISPTVIPDAFAKAAPPENCIDGTPIVSFPFYIDAHQRPFANKLLPPT